MLATWGQGAARTLGRRIVASVALGLGLILLLFGLVALWTIQQSTEAAYRERVALAQALVWHVDAVLGYAQATLEREAAGLSFDPRQPLSDAHRRQLAELRLQLGSFAILTVTDMDGRGVWTEPQRADIRIGGPLPHPAVQAALRSGQPQIAEFTPNANGGSPFACLAIPLLDARGQLVGALMAEVDPRHPALNLLPPGPVGEAMHVHLINAAGRVLAGSEELHTRGAQAHQLLLADLMAERTAGYRVHQTPPGADVDDHVVAYAPASLLPSWGVVVEQPRDVVLATPRQLQQRLGFFGVAALLVAGAVAWFDARRVVRPLRHLTAAAQRFAAGDLEAPVRLARSDELGILAHAFETMRQRLRASLAEVAAWNRELEQRVAGRTAEVERLNESLCARERERAELLQRVIAGQEEERRRLAQELHDEASQTLASLLLGLERLAGDDGQPEPTRALARELRTLAGATLAEVHRLAVELRPSVLDDVGLVAAVDRYLRETAERWRLAVDFAAVGAEGLRLIPGAEAAVYRIVQAALTNVVQHARARRVSVLLQRRSETLVVVVEDDGCGFDPDAVRRAALEQRLGLAGMEERARLIGASLTLESAPGAGATVFLEVPLGPNCRKEDAHAEAAAAAG